MADNLTPYSGNGDHKHDPSEHNGDHAEEVHEAEQMDFPEGAMFEPPQNIGFSVRFRCFVFVFAFFAAMWSLINSLAVTIYMLLNIITLFNWRVGQILMYRFTGATMRWLHIAIGSFIFAFMPGKGLAYLFRFILSEAKEAQKSMLFRYMQQNMHRDPYDEE